MEINQKENELHLYPINNNEYLGAINVNESNMCNDPPTTIILDQSKSMGFQVERFVTQIIPLVMWKLNYAQNHRINLITFAKYSTTHRLTSRELEASNIVRSKGTHFALAIEALRHVLEEFVRDSPNVPMRVLTISDGEIRDTTEAEDETRRLTEFLARSDLTINSQAVRLFTSDSQPDTQALSYLLQINNATPTQLYDAWVQFPDETIANEIVKLFQKDCFQNYQVLTFERSIVLKFPWNTHASMRVILSRGWNVFWFRQVPSGVKLGNGRAVNVIVQDQLSLGVFHELMESKLEYIADHMIILKIVGTREASETADTIFECLRRQEDALALKSSGSSNKVISNLLNGIAKNETDFRDSNEMADFLRNTRNEIETQRERDRKKREEEKEKEAVRLKKEKEEKEKAAEEEAARIKKLEEAKEKAAEEEAARIKKQEEEKAAKDVARLKEKEEREKAAEEEAARIKKQEEEAAEAVRIKKLEEEKAAEEAARLKEKEKKEKAAEEEAARIKKQEEEAAEAVRIKKLEDEAAEAARLKEKEEKEKAAEEEAARIKKQEEEREKAAEEEAAQIKKIEEEKAIRIKKLEEEEKAAEEETARIKKLEEEKAAEEETTRIKKLEEEKAAEEEAFRIKRDEEESACAKRDEQEWEEKLHWNLKLDEQKKLEAGLLFAQEPIKAFQLQKKLDEDQSTELQHINEKQVCVTKLEFAYQAAMGHCEYVGVLESRKKKRSLITTAANKVRQFTGALRSGRNNNSNPNPIQTVFILHENMFVPKKHCRFAEKIIPLVFSKISNENSQLVHLLTVAANQTPVVQMLQSILQTLDANEPIRIMVLTDMTSQEQQQFDNFAETLIKFLSGSNFSFEFYVVRIASECQKKLLGGDVSRKYQLIDIDSKKSNVYIAAQIVELFHSTNFQKHEQEQLPMITKNSETKDQSTDVMSLDVDGKQSKSICKSCGARYRKHHRSRCVIYILIFAIIIISLLFVVAVYKLKK